MRRVSATRLSSLPKRKAGFIEPMDCAPVSKLIDGPEWVYEVLCGPPHLDLFCGVRRYVAQGMRFWLGVHTRGPRRHIIPIVSLDYRRSSHDTTSPDIFGRIELLRPGVVRY